MFIFTIQLYSYNTKYSARNSLFVYLFNQGLGGTSSLVYLFNYLYI